MRNIFVIISVDLNFFPMYCTDQLKKIVLRKKTEFEDLERRLDAEN
jgi:hypothetical protein